MPMGSAVRASATAIEGPDGGRVTTARAGDRDASEVLVRRHGEMINRSLVAILGNRSDPSTLPDVPNRTPPVSSAQ
jgi:hypothetical protein